MGCFALTLICALSPYILPLTYIQPLGKYMWAWHILGFIQNKLCNNSKACACYIKNIDFEEEKKMKLCPCCMKPFNYYYYRT